MLFSVTERWSRHPSDRWRRKPGEPLRIAEVWPRCVGQAYVPVFPLFLITHPSSPQIHRPDRKGYLSGREQPTALFRSLSESRWTRSARMFASIYRSLLLYALSSHLCSGPAERKTVTRERIQKCGGITSSPARKPSRLQQPETCSWLPIPFLRNTGKTSPGASPTFHASPTFLAASALLPDSPQALGSLATLFSQVKGPSFPQHGGSSPLGRPPLPWMTLHPHASPKPRDTILDLLREPWPAEGRHCSPPRSRPSVRVTQKRCGWVGLLCGGI